MSPRRSHIAFRRARVAALVGGVLAGLLALGLAGAGGALLRLVGAGDSHGASALADTAQAPPTADDTFAPELGLPATGVVAFGTSTQEPPEKKPEMWAYGELGGTPIDVDGHAYNNQYALLEHTEGHGWQVVPLPPGPDGKPLAVHFGTTTPTRYGAFAGAATVTGGVVLLSGQSVVVRDPDAAPRLASVPAAIGSHAGADEVLAPGESLLPPAGFPEPPTLPYAAIEDSAGAPTPHTGVLIAPYNDGGAPNSAGEPSTPPGVLHYDGDAWTREPIALPQSEQNSFTALALACGGTPSAPAASSPSNCWLLAGYRVGTGRGTPNQLALFRRVSAADTPGGYSWQPVQVSGGLLGAQASTSVAPLGQGAQMLTATAQGVWVDFQAKITPPAPDGLQESSSVSELVTPTATSAASVLGSWCYPTGPGCAQSLGASLPSHYRSFAWPGAGGEPGTRVITGLPDRAMLELSNGRFTYTVGAGGGTGMVPGAAAFTPPGTGGRWQGWIADGAEPSNAPDGEGQSQVIAVTPAPEGDQLGQEAVPFRRPLYALAQPPGTTPGNPGAPAVAVGEMGQIARYQPGLGWRPEALYESNGQVKATTLRGVAWPEPGRIYAVGDNGAMWLWRAETGLWEPDPAKPFNFIGDLTAIAFDPSQPLLGYAVGKQGALLRYGKSWEQVPLPPELQQANFTSIAFAGGEAIASYRMVVPNPEHPDTMMETGGLAVEEENSGPEPGTHWHVDPGAAALLAQLPGEDHVLSKVAGLPDGGAVAAGPGKVIEQEAPGAGWHFSAQPLPEAEDISALAAYRDATGRVRAMVSIDLDRQLDPQSFDNNLQESPFKGDVPPPTGPGQAPAFLEPDPLPNSGYLLKETAGGWSDMEHAALPAPTGELPTAMPVRPDPVLALLVEPSGATGLAVGGQTGDLEGKGLGIAHSKNVDYQTAAALRFPASAASADGTSSPSALTAPAGQASFIVGGQAACAQESCADFAGEGLGSDVWLTHALQSADEMAGASSGGLHGFLYTGGRLPARESGEAFTRELERYASLFGAAGTLPVYAADSPDTGPYVPNSASPNYSLISQGAGGPVKLIVLDCSTAEIGAAQRTWLREQLESARDSEHVPAIVMGNAALGFTLPDQSTSANQIANEALDATEVAQILVEGEASAYLFDYPGANVKTSISYNGSSIPAYGTGTLGYVTPAGTFEADSLGSSGTLLASVHTSEHRDPDHPNVVPVSAEAIPNIGSLALDATNGVLLRRSEVALFEALARRPVAGVAISNGNGLELAGPEPYDQIPFDCQGRNCAYEVPTQYTFTSSKPDIAGFVEHEASSNNPRQVQLGPNKLPVPDEPLDADGRLNPDGRFTVNAKGEPVNEKGEVVAPDQSGILCAYNEGTTTISITTGGLTYSEPVTVQGGSVEYPCGTVPLKNPPPKRLTGELEVPPFSSPEPAKPTPVVPAVHLAVPPVPVVHHPAIPPRISPPPKIHPPHKNEVKPPPFIRAPAQLLPVLAVVLPPPPPTPRPTPPSGTAEVPAQSPVSQPVGAAEAEEQEEAVTEHVHNAAAYAHDDQGPMPGWPLALVLVAAAAGMALGPRVRARQRRRAFVHSSNR